MKRGFLPLPSLVVPSTIIVFHPEFKIVEALKNITSNTSIPIMPPPNPANDFNTNVKNPDEGGPTLVSFVLVSFIRFILIAILLFYHENAN